ncbi:hypothetical protein EKO23_01865 [Nocardioides guangzhouensis]|uniref:Uncharacterized protein n=1 Tax=Nocardioides guangzhouensis TaxID=2497878 RepID=A0A4Q4ZM22_9ACTN|nr:hypothetical protein [Nocardioides guangzhouensis]RYP88661.1 hypothetical protein EKO23_01865 [Nocardioides guangzhouensis]
MSPGDTWWGVLLDGLFGGVIGGAATGAAVWATLRHEKRSARLQRLHASAARLSEMATVLSQEVASAIPDEVDRGDLRSWAAQVRLIQASSLDLWAGISDDEPDAAQLLDGLRARLAASTLGRRGEWIEQRNAALEALGSLSSFAVAWMTEPEQFVVKKRRRVTFRWPISRQLGP